MDDAKGSHVHKDLDAEMKVVMVSEEEAGVCVLAVAEVTGVEGEPGEAKLMEVEADGHVEEVLREDEMVIEVEKYDVHVGKEVAMG